MAAAAAAAGSKILPVQISQMEKEGLGIQSIHRKKGNNTIAGVGNLMFFSRFFVSVSMHVGGNLLERVGGTCYVLVPRPSTLGVQRCDRGLA
jgi:hypothetical protein